MSERKSIQAAQAIARELRRAIAKLAGQPFAAGEFLRLARAVIRRHEPLLSRAMRDALLESFLEAARKTAAVVPPPSSPATPFAMPAPAGEPVIRLPLIEAAAADLAARQLLTPDDYARLDQDARRVAFTIARATSAETVRKVREALVEDLRDGGTLRQFRRKVAAAVDPILSPAQVEAVYRTHIAVAHGAGQRAVLEHPLVADEFPYLEWAAIHDTRVDPAHLAMETHGLDGTAVYRADDPLWRTHTPPIRWNCRCALIPLSVADAAAKGVREAKEWLRTNVPPATPQWVAGPHPANPPRGWPTGGNIVAVV